MMRTPTSSFGSDPCPSGSPTDENAASFLNPVSQFAKLCRVQYDMMRTPTSSFGSDPCPSGSPTDENAASFLNPVTQFAKMFCEVCCAQRDLQKTTRSPTPRPPSLPTVFKSEEFCKMGFVRRRKNQDRQLSQQQLPADEECPAASADPNSYLYDPKQKELVEQRANIAEFMKNREKDGKTVTQAVTLLAFLACVVVATMRFGFAP